MSSVQNSKYLLILISVFITFYVTSAVLVNRLVSLGHSYITGGTFLFVISTLLCDVVTEVYGYRVARQMLWSGIISWFLLAISVEIIIRLPYPSFWGSYYHAYYIIMAPLMRSVFSGSFAVIIGQFINTYLISKWKILLRGRYFWLRSFGSSAIGDVLTTILALSGIFMGRISFEHLISTIVPEVVILLLCSAVGAFPASILVKLLKKSEGVDVYDHGVNFNPFKLQVND